MCNGVASCCNPLRKVQLIRKKFETTPVTPSIYPAKFLTLQRCNILRATCIDLRFRDCHTGAHWFFSVTRCNLQKGTATVAKKRNPILVFAMIVTASFAMILTCAKGVKRYNDLCSMSRNGIDLVYTNFLQRVTRMRNETL